MKRALLTTALMTLIVVSCAINPNLNELNSSTSKIEIPVNMNRASQPLDKTAAYEYRLGFGDVVEIKFFNNSEYNDVVAVRPDGKITLQRIGDVDVVNMRVSQLDSIITESYREILVDPEATVIVREFGGQSVYVMGEVMHPGRYDITKGMSLLRAITTAGGPLGSAKMNSVVLLRGNERLNLTAERINLMPGNLETLLNNDVEIRPYDLVYVPKTFIADLETFVSQFYKVVVPPLDLATRFIYYNAIR